ncbi:MAG: phenylalanine--tRNA ligase subunit beta [Thermoleophilia bacterium]
MKAPLSWLREYVRIELSADELASRLALTGTEVERVTAVGVPADPAVLGRFVVGKVLTCDRHPNADKLSVCRVDVGEGEARTIVCGAPNVAAGQTVGVSLPGAVLPNGMKIGEAKLRGVTSAGMILSEAELGFAAKSGGIMVLPDEWPAGAPLAEFLPLAEQVLEVEVTPNRPDCLSVQGLAREIAAVTGQPLTEEHDFSYVPGSRRVEQDVTVEVWAPDLCPRYAARVIRGVTVADSPTWLKARITHAGMRPVNNVVDVTNYVMWALGQPLHAFDLARVRGGRIIARRAAPGETIVTLDGVNRILTDDMLVIADAERPSVIAGIMGSLDSEVTDQTVDVLLEAANFHGPAIMKTSSKLGLRSESSTRFEKGLDPNLIPAALDMACRMLVDLCGGTVSAGTADVAAGQVSPWDVPLRPSRVEAILGKPVAVEEMETILRRLGCGVVRAEGVLVVTVPTFRRDLEREIDLVEEVARIHGLEKLPSTQPMRPHGRGGLNAEQRRRRAVVDALVGAGLSEVVTYSFIDPVWLGHLRLPPDDPRRWPLAIANPLSSDQSVMRTMLLPGLLATAGRNLAVREERVHIFELGATFHPEGHTLPRERRALGVVLLGRWEPDCWAATGVPTDFFLLKGLLDRIFAALGVSAEYETAAEPFLHPGKSAVVRVMQETLGWLGEVHPLVLQAFALPDGVLAAELDAGALIAAARGVALFEDLLTYPAVEQDLALVVSRDLPARRVIAAVQEAGGSLLHTVRLFDTYEGPQVGEGRKSLALRLTFRSEERTLSEAEVNDLRTAMLARLRTAIGAELRA